MASAISEVKKMEMTPMRVIYSEKTGLKLGRCEAEGHCVGAKRLRYRG